MLFFSINFTHSDFCFIFGVTKTANDMATQVTFESEWKRRMDLVENPKFRQIAIEAAKKLGITAEEWNANRAGLLLMFANEICSLENKKN